MTKATTLAPLLESFFRQRLVHQQGACEGAIDSYRDALKLLLLFASNRCRRPPCSLRLEDLDQETVLAFLDHLETERGNVVRTRNARLTAIRSFFHHAARVDPSAVGIAQRVVLIPAKRADRKLVGHLTPEETAALLAAPDRATRRGRRDRALLLFLVRTGARESEAKDVNITDVRMTPPYQVLLRGKGSKERLVPLDETTVLVLKELQHERPAGVANAAAMFINHRGVRLTRYGVIHIVRRCVAKAGTTQPALLSRRVSPHTLRHTCGMDLLRAGIDLETIRAWLGHVSLDTTHQYVEADMEMKRRALHKCEFGSEPAAVYKPTDAILAFLETL